MQYNDPGLPLEDDITNKSFSIDVHPCFNKHDMQLLKEDLWQYACVELFYNNKGLYVWDKLPPGLFDATRHYLNGWMRGSFPK